MGLRKKMADKLDEVESKIARRLFPDESADVDRETQRLVEEDQKRKEGGKS